MSELSIPSDLLKLVRAKSSRQQESRFPHKLWRLLDWTGDDPFRRSLTGCGWVTDTIFSVEKSVLAEVLNIRHNTLNGNFAQLGFHQPRHSNGPITFWSAQGFSKQSRSDDLSRIRNSRGRSESPQTDVRALFATILGPIQIWSMTPNDRIQFTRDVVIEWHRLLGKAVLFAIKTEDLHSLILKEFGENNKMLIEAALIGRQSGICDILDFAVFFARFGPLRTVFVKLKDYLAGLGDIVLSEGSEVLSFAGQFSKTFHNCFRFRISPMGEFHCYNLPWIEGNDNFLIDEDGKSYRSWREMIQQNQIFLSSGN
jgi:hypothetical protein